MLNDFDLNTVGQTIDSNFEVSNTFLNNTGKLGERPKTGQSQGLKHNDSTYSIAPSNA
jgi:hypothetical protein